MRIRRRDKQPELDLGPLMTREELEWLGRANAGTPIPDGFAEDPRRTWQPGQTDHTGDPNIHRWIRNLR
ncbi:MAG TPA: hypothetical protein VLB73_02550 [Patescibacteria group bacterium]|nr:hypothetical protein [Patescibacteria group bacterium]